MTRLPTRSPPAERTLEARGVLRGAATVDLDDRQDEPLDFALGEKIGSARSRLPAVGIHPRGSLTGSARLRRLLADSA